MKIFLKLFLISIYFILIIDESIAGSPKQPGEYRLISRVLICREMNDMNDLYWLGRGTTENKYKNKLNELSKKPDACYFIDKGTIVKVEKYSPADGNIIEIVINEQIFYAFDNNFLKIVPHINN